MTTMSQTSWIERSWNRPRWGESIGNTFNASIVKPQCLQCHWMWAKRATRLIDTGIRRINWQNNNNKKREWEKKPMKIKPVMQSMLSSLFFISFRLDRLNCRRDDRQVIPWGRFIWLIIIIVSMYILLCEWSSGLTMRMLHEMRRTFEKTKCQNEKSSIRCCRCECVFGNQLLRVDLEMDGDVC